MTTLEPEKCVHFSICIFWQRITTKHANSKNNQLGEKQCNCLTENALNNV